MKKLEKYLTDINENQISFPCSLMEKITFRGETAYNVSCARKTLKTNAHALKIC